MNRFKIATNLMCAICNNLAVYACKALNEKICRFCCDNYQLSNKPINECLKCDYLFRDDGYEVKLNHGMILSHNYREKFIFDNDFKSFHFKTVELYERIGVTSRSEMYNLAIQYKYANREADALNLFNKIVINKNISNDGKMAIYEQMGDVLLMLQKATEAKEAYIKSLDYGNRNPKIFRRLGEVYNILKEYSQSIYYHEKALAEYSPCEWEDDDFLYFTNYYSLAMGYSELDNHNKVIENANAFIDYYGDFERIKERYFTKVNVIGDSFMPESIVSMYKLVSLTYIELNDLLSAINNIAKARALSEQDLELAKIEGFVEGKLDSYEMNLEVEKLRQAIVEKDRAIMILIQNSEDKSIKSYNIRGDVYMGSKYHIENSGTIVNQVFGDNVTINNGELYLKEIGVILSEITENIDIVGNEDTQKHINEINNSIKSKKLSGLKNQLSNLLVGVTAGCIANEMPHILTMISNVISKLQ